MASLTTPHSVCGGAALRFGTRQFGQRPHRCARLFSSKAIRGRGHRRVRIHALLTPPDDPIVKEALEEPLAFWGGVFAGLFRLDLNEDPLREWLAKTSKAAGIQNVEDVDDAKEETPEEITIE